MNEFTGDYYLCNLCGHIWDFKDDACPECGNSDQIMTHNRSEMKALISESEKISKEEQKRRARIRKLLARHGDLK